MLDRPLWFDEIFTLWAARGSFSRLLEILANDSAPPLFYLLERPFVLLGELTADDRLSRLLSFAAILLLLPLTVTALPAGRARAAGAALLGGSPLLNLYAAEARPYALLALLVLGLFLVALRIPESLGGAAATALLTAASLHTHYLAILAVGALGLLALLRRRWKSAGGLLAGALTFLPWTQVLLGQPEAALAWMRETPGRAIAGFLSSLGGVGRIPPPFGPPLPKAWPVAGILVGLVLLGLLLSAARRDDAVRDALLFVALVLTAAICISLRRPLAFAGRTELAVLPVWIWAVARRAGDGRGPMAAAGAAAALGLTATLLMAAAPRPPAARIASAGGIERIASAGDLLFAFPPHYLPARLSRERGSLAAELQGIPPEIRDHPGWWRPRAISAEDLAPLVGEMGRATPGKRIFVMVPRAYRVAALERLLSTGGELRILGSAGGAVLMLWTPRAPPSEPH